MSFENGPPVATAADVSLFELSFFAFPLSAAEKRLSGDAALPVSVFAEASVAPPLCFTALSMRASDFSSACVLSVIWNCRKAEFCTSASARARSSMPGSSTTMRSLPTFCTTGSDTPNSSMRLRTTFSARSIASPLFCTTPLLSSTSSARYIPPCRSSPRLSGMRVRVVSRNSPVFGLRSRTVMVRGHNAQTDATTSARMMRSRLRILAFMRLKDGFGDCGSALNVMAGQRLSQRKACFSLVLTQLCSERLGAVELPRLTEARENIDAHGAIVEIALRIEEMRLDGDRVVPERRARTQVHHAAELTEVRLCANGIHPGRR